jgi:hypothetical protein
MSSLYDVMGALAAAVKTAVTGLTAGTPPVALNVLVGTDWPSINVLQNVANGTSGPVVAVFDRRVGKNSTRWSPFTYDQVVTPAALTTALVPVSGAVAPLGTCTIDLGGTPGVGDAVSCVVTNQALVVNVDGVLGPIMAAQVVSAIAGDTASTMATKLAAAINGDATLGTWLTAVAAGPVVTLTSLVAGAPLLVASFAGNGGTQQRELGRRDRQFSITCWVATLEARRAVVDAIAVLIANLQIVFLTAADGSPVQVLFGNDFDLDDNTLEDVYRHDFLVHVDYGITTTDQLYAVLAPVRAYATD